MPPRYEKYKIDTAMIERRDDEVPSITRQRSQWVKLARGYSYSRTQNCEPSPIQTTPDCAPPRTCVVRLDSPLSYFTNARKAVTTDLYTAHT